MIGAPFVQRARKEYSLPCQRHVGDANSMHIAKTGWTVRAGAVGKPPVTAPGPTC